MRNQYDFKNTKLKFWGVNVYSVHMKKSPWVSVICNVELICVVNDFRMWLVCLNRCLLLVQYKFCWPALQWLYKELGKKLWCWHSTIDIWSYMRLIHHCKSCFRIQAWHCCEYVCLKYFGFIGHYRGKNSYILEQKKLLFNTWLLTFRLLSRLYSGHLGHTSFIWSLLCLSLPQVLLWPIWRWEDKNYCYEVTFKKMCSRSITGRISWAAMLSFLALHHAGAFAYMQIILSLVHCNKTFIVNDSTNLQKNLINILSLLVLSLLTGVGNLP